MEKFKNMIVFSQYQGIAGWTKEQLLAFLCGYHQNGERAMDDLKWFETWIKGQTVIRTDNGETLYYAADILRWLSSSPVID